LSTSPFIQMLLLMSFLELLHQLNLIIIQLLSQLPPLPPLFSPAPLLFRADQRTSGLSFLSYPETSSFPLSYFLPLSPSIS
jgi:hypothetical protein